MPTHADATPPAPDHALSALRGEIDSIDDALHDLVMRRAAVVARLAASRVKGDASSLRPGREARILRRLLARHAGALPPSALVRLWREILGASNAMQGAFLVALPEGDAALEKAARSRFGAMAKPHYAAGPEAALALLAAGSVQAAALPVPAEAGAGAWWTGLDAPRLQVVSRLPFYAVEGLPRAMVVTRDGPDPSDDDRSLLRLVLDAGGLPNGAANAVGAVLRGVGFVDRSVLLHGQQDSVLALAEVDGAVAEDDPRLSALAGRSPVNRAQPLGFYATPVRPAAEEGD